MRKIPSVCAVALLAAVIVGSWAMSTKAKAPNTPEVTAAAMSPFDMMLKAVEMPVHVIVDAI
jgi:hypothetical protein